MVSDAAAASGVSTPSVAANSMPKTSYTTRWIAKAPALTTATACSSADTGAGATIALGSQPCSGTRAALTPKPTTSAANSSTRVPECSAAKGFR